MARYADYVLFYYVDDDGGDRYEFFESIDELNEFLSALSRDYGNKLTFVRCFRMSHELEISKLVDISYKVIDNERNI